MNELEPEEYALISDDVSRLNALGLSEYQVKIGDFGPESISYDFPLPHTVLQLFTIARALHFKYLKSEDGQVVGTIYSFAESSDALPVGLMKVEVGTPIVENAKLLTAAIADLPGKPRLDSPALNNRSYLEVIQDAQLQRYLDSRYGGITVTRLKPGPEERSMDEVIEIVERWRKWKQGNHSQQAFCEHQGWGSRTILTDCLRRYRVAFGPKSI